jgi:hopanoid biosynthesis associated protein HpnK
MTRQLIITADDFGMSLDVNEAVEEAHRKGVLTCASLVVTGQAATDAVSRARRMPSLGVGLHLALLSAPPALDPAEVPALLDRDGRWLGGEPAAIGTRIALSPGVRAQARAEIRAQLELFRRTGLPLDHVDGHWHFHQHPSVVKALVELAREFAIRAVRVPYEPALPSWRAGGRTDLVRRLETAVTHLPLATLMKRVLRRAGILCNDWFFGMNDGGAVTRERLLGYLAHLRPGVTEIGLHPARRTWAGPHAPPAHWRLAEELAGLTDKDVIAACRGPRQRLVRFGDLVGSGVGR